MNTHEHDTDLPYDLRLELRVKNNALWNAIHHDCKTVAEFCRKHKLSQQVLSEFLNLRRHPLTTTGEWKSVPLKLAEDLGFGLEELFPLRIYNEVDPGMRVIEVSSFSALPDTRDVLRIADQRTSAIDAAAKESAKEKVREALKTLTAREAAILRLRFGFGEEGEPDHEGYTLEECGRIFNISKDRVRQIEARALRKLQGFCQGRRKLLESAAEELA